MGAAISRRSGRNRRKSSADRQAVAEAQQRQVSNATVIPQQTSGPRQSPTRSVEQNNRITVSQSQTTTTTIVASTIVTPSTPQQSTGLPPLNPSVKDPLSLGQIITPRGEDSDLQISIPYTPQGDEASIYRYYCPLCMLYFKRIYKSNKCCSNYICRQCTVDYLETKGLKKLPNNIAIIIKTYPTQLETISCPHCTTTGFSPVEVSYEDTVRDYSMKNDGANNIANTATAVHRMRYDASPVRAGETFDDLKRKMIPYSNKLTKTIEYEQHDSAVNNNNHNENSDRHGFSPICEDNIINNLNNINTADADDADDNSGFEGIAAGSIGASGGARLFAFSNTASPVHGHPQPQSQSQPQSESPQLHPPSIIRIGSVNSQMSYTFNNSITSAGSFSNSLNNLVGIASLALATTITSEEDTDTVTETGEQAHAQTQTQQQATVHSGRNSIEMNDSTHRPALSRESSSARLRRGNIPRPVSPAVMTVTIMTGATLTLQQQRELQHQYGSHSSVINNDVDVDGDDDDDVGLPLSSFLPTIATPTVSARNTTTAATPAVTASELVSGFLYHGIAAVAGDGMVSLSGTPYRNNHSINNGSDTNSPHTITTNNSRNSGTTAAGSCSGSNMDSNGTIVMTNTHDTTLDISGRYSHGSNSPNRRNDNNNDSAATDDNGDDDDGSEQSIVLRNRRLEFDSVATITTHVSAVIDTISSSRRSSREVAAAAARATTTVSTQNTGTSHGYNSTAWSDIVTDNEGQDSQQVNATDSQQVNATDSQQVNATDSQQVNATDEAAKTQTYAPTSEPTEQQQQQQHQQHQLSSSSSSGRATNTANTTTTDYASEVVTGIFRDAMLHQRRE